MHHLQKITGKFRSDGRFRVFLTVRFLLQTALVLASCFAVIFQASPAFSQNLEPGETELSETEIQQGWLSLFDGESLFGWHKMSEANWAVVDGAIQVTRGEQGLLRTSAQFDDFELRLEFKATPETNSGIFLRTSPSPEDPAVDCFELNIADRSANPFPTGSLVGRTVTELDFDVTDWNQVRVIAEGDRMQVWINDQLTCDYRDPKPGGPLGRGYIGLQHNSGPVAFRKLLIRPLNVPVLSFDDLANNWKSDEARNSTFHPAPDGALRMLNGPGQLETRESFGNFVFSMQCKTNAPGLNSGVFFRCIPGEFMNGYESQIQNQFHENDRTRPVDCGTGGIFRRAHARQVVADDEKWFAKTIIACGANISVWVNGVQVTDWTDQRPLDPNPRKGRRLEAGTMILQGHDPTTDILFKDIRVRELSSRGR